MVWIYHGDTFKGFDSFDEACAWTAANDPEGVAFEYPEYEIGTFEDTQAIDWRTVVKDGSPVWHGPEQACLRFVADPAFREEKMRRQKAHDR